ncbi:M90 family metallopeptidase [uncultured Tateyamaria sp.]|uniref:M90 family metallopeptidase n=1 Tax=uncultured Tateyamaria sp. TaxID=455651 RepID=UPI00262107FA|nr:M90 family metallopeptidase [uncultured Tateyamaria sp.]
MPLFLLLILAGLGAFIYVRHRRKQAQARLLAMPLTDDARRIVARHVPLLARLPASLRPALEGKINRFRAQVDMVGCNGLDVTEEMELSIAAQACLLVVNTDSWYDHLTTILIYPGAFKSRQTIHDGYVETEAEVVRTGESWSRGPVILSWHHSQQGAQDEDDGHNVVLHEFAHQLDDLSGYTDGAPVMQSGQSLRVWEQVFVDAHARHAAKVERGQATVIDPYGAHNHEEFFAVAVEMFFERPGDLKDDEPDVYAQLKLLFRLDPVTWG